MKRNQVVAKPLVLALLLVAPWGACTNEPHAPAFSPTGSGGATGTGGTGGPWGEAGGCDDYEACCQSCGGGGEQDDLAKPVLPPTSGEPHSDANRTIAVKALHLGDTDIDPESPSYKDLGFDLDGVNSYPTWGHHCKAPKSTQKEVRQDGANGIDNMFSKKIVTTLAGVAGDALVGLSGNIAKGEFSIVLQIDGLGEGENYIGLPARVYGVHGPRDASKAVIPVTDFSTYPWDPLDSQSQGVSFPHSYMNHHVWVSGAPADFPIGLAIGSAWITLHVHQAVIQTKFDSTNTSTSEGIIAGAVMTDEILSQVPTIAGALGQCDLSSFQSALDSFKNFSDIYVDETGKIVLDPTKDCNAMSVGIGFDAVTSRLESVFDYPVARSSCD